MSNHDLVHQHLIISANVKKDEATITLESLQGFLNDLVKYLNMRKLFDPITINGKYGFTGIVGIVTSHIAFHYFDGGLLQMDIYSCKEFDVPLTIQEVDLFWGLSTGIAIELNRSCRGVQQTVIVLPAAH